MKRPKPKVIGCKDISLN